jgi:hypothetical protein
MNPIVEYRFLLGQYCRLVSEKRKPQDLTKVLKRLDELWNSMTEDQQRSIWK